MCDCDCCDYRDDYEEPSRADMIRELVEYCDSPGDLLELVREMRAEFRRQNILRNPQPRDDYVTRLAMGTDSMGFRLFPADEWYRVPTPDEMRQELALAEREERIRNRGPNVMSPSEVRQMVVDDFRRKHGGPFKGEA